MSEIFFIGDTHFGHTKILEFEKEIRVFKDIDHHDRVLIDNWNKVVTPKDVVYHLGDVVLGSSHKYRQLKQLNGIIKLILGNHDRFSQLYPYFHTFYGATKFEGIVLTHIPVNPNQLEFRFKYNMHGHTHSKNLNDKRYINVSCEQINLTPVNYEIIKKRIKDYED